MAIVLYGQWIAYSVAEEKSSRVLELILGAATPFELLAGKVRGVGALALTQYGLVAVAAIVSLIFQGQIAALVFGGAAAPVDLPAGPVDPAAARVRRLLRPRLRRLRGLYAGVASLVSRTEDINQIVAPMTILSSIGYIVAVYASTGVLDANSTLVVVLSYIPFFSPYLMVRAWAQGWPAPSRRRSPS